MKVNLFRKSALDRLSSPEKLDTMMQVTTSKGWIALIAVGVIIILVSAWSIVGEIPTKVNGQGILIKSGGVLDVVPLTTGQVTDLYVSAGDIIEKGQVIARIAQPYLTEEIKKAEAKLAELKIQHEEMVAFGAKEVRLQKAYFAKQSENLNYSIETTEEQLRWLNERMSLQDGLLEKGLITKQTLLDTRQRYYNVQELLERYKNDLNQINIQELSLVNRKEQERLSSQIRINDSERRLKHLQADMKLNANVVSPYSGRILEILSEKGGLAQIGHPLIRLDLVGEEAKTIEVVLYVGPTEGKKIRPGMDVQIEPATVKREEFGFMYGTVQRVAQFPSTKEGMRKVLKNDQLVKDWSKEGAPFEVYAELVIDESSESGFKWSSVSGPPLKVYSGTLCSSSIIVRKQKPISLVIPILKEYTGI